VINRKQTRIPKNQSMHDTFLRVCASRSTHRKAILRVLEVLEQRPAHQLLKNVHTEHIYEHLEEYDHEGKDEVVDQILSRNFKVCRDLRLPQVRFPPPTTHVSNMLKKPTTCRDSATSLFKMMIAAVRSGIWYKAMISADILLKLSSIGSISLPLFSSSYRQANDTQACSSTIQSRRTSANQIARFVSLHTRVSISFATNAASCAMRRLRKKYNLVRARISGYEPVNLRMSGPM